MPKSRAETIMYRLELHAAEWFTDIDGFKQRILMSHYFSLPNSMGGVMRPAESYTLQGGKVITFKDVPISKIVKEVESAIKRLVPEDRRTEIYHLALTAMPGHKSTPDWDQRPVNRESIYAEPATPFSKPRDEKLTNEDLLELLAPAAGMTLSSADSIGIQICWWDAMSDGKFSAMMSFTGGVKGGRLGDDHHHTTSDVPINYFRDRLMDWISQNEEDKQVQQAARKAICPDLTDDEIEEYTRLIEQDRKKMEEKAEADRRDPNSQPTREQLAKEVLADGKVTTLAQAMKVVMMEEAVSEIDSTIDWQTPKLTGARRRWGWELAGSVTSPHWAPLGIERVIPDTEVDRDCDQVRAMIKIFTMTWSSWSAEDFRFALGDIVTRDKFLTFLKNRGTDNTQKRSAAYLLSWEFFHRREKLGLPLADADPRSDLDKLIEMREDAERTDRQRALIAVQRQDKKDLEEKHDLEREVLRKVHKEQDKILKKAHVNALKALAEANPLGTPGRSEKLRELAEKQRKEVEARSKEHDEQTSVQGDAHWAEIKEQEAIHEKQMDDLKEEERLEAQREKEQREALAEARPSRLNKRASGGGGRGRAKKARK